MSIAFDAATENELEEDKADEEVVEDGQEDIMLTMLLKGAIGSSATFLLGVRTCFRRF